MTRILGLDIGDSRIGLALSDPLGILATPLTIINRTDDQSASEQIADIVRKNEVELIVAGLPLNMDGSQGTQAEKTKKFVETLSSYIEIPVEFRDERLSTVSARELMRDTGKKSRETRYDAAAAALILQSYLDEKADRRPDDNISPPPPPV